MRALFRKTFFSKQDIKICCYAKGCMAKWLCKKFHWIAKRDSSVARTSPESSVAILPWDKYFCFNLSSNYCPYEIVHRMNLPHFGIFERINAFLSLQVSISEVVNIEKFRRIFPTNGRKVSNFSFRGNVFSEWRRPLISILERDRVELKHVSERRCRL